MANKSGQTFELPKRSSMIAELISTQEVRDDATREKVMEIPLSEIDPFPNHPFQVKQDDAMHSMAESVKTFGIQTPAIVRQKEDGRYELISGHRRKMACEIVGLNEMPSFVRQLSEMEAIISMVDSNLQRETILPSEKAKSYKMRLEAMNKQAGRPKNENLTPVESEFKGIRTNEELAIAVGESREQIRRYIRLNELIPQILEMVDNSVIREKGTLQIAMRPAVELSYLTAEQQKILFDEMLLYDNTPSHAQAIKMRTLAGSGKLDANTIKSIMREVKANQIELIKIPMEIINKYFAADTPRKDIEDTIIRALELVRQKERSRAAR